MKCGRTRSRTRRRQSRTMTFASPESAEWRTDPALSRNLKPPALSRWSIHILSVEAKHRHGRVAVIGPSPRGRRRSELGQNRRFGTPLRRVWNTAMNRHSVPNVGDPLVSVPSGAAERRSRMCHKYALAGLLGYVRVPTKGDAALISLCARVLCRSGHRVRGTPSAEIMPFLRGG